MVHGNEVTELAHQVFHLDDDFIGLHCADSGPCVATDRRASPRAGSGALLPCAQQHHEPVFETRLGRAGGGAVQQGIEPLLVRLRAAG